MSSDSVTQASVVARAEEDAVLAGRQDRCAMIGRIVEWSDAEIPTGCGENLPAVASGKADSTGPGTGGDTGN
jgi:hypothetical protein